MDNDKLKKLFDFATEIEKLKKMERYKGQFYWKDYPAPIRYESVADHTWRLGMLVLLLANQLSQKLDLEKALKMVLVHDLPEIEAGDASPLGHDGTGVNTYAFNKQKAAEKHESEKKAAVAFFSSLPPEQSKDLLNLWIECEQQKTFEAKVVKSLDKIEALMQVLEYRNGHLFEEHLKFTIEYGLKGSDIDSAIQQFGKHVADELKKKYKEFTK